MKVPFEAPRVAAGGLLFLLAAGACDLSPAKSEATDLGRPGLSSTFESPEALARAVLTAFEARDKETLKTLPLSKEEFRVHVWPKLPASRPERNIPFDYGWGDLQKKSVNSIASNFARYEGRKLELVSIRFRGETTDYGSFRIHRKSELLVKDETGKELKVALFGSVLEWSGRYKIFSYVTD